MKVINLYGGPCSGKTTTAAGLYYYMKRRHMRVKLIQEYAEELVYEGFLENMLDQQERIFAEQNRRQHILRGKVDWAITDSPLALSLVYPRMNQKQKGVAEWPALEPFETFVGATIRTYDNVNIFLARPDHYQEYGREHTLEQAIEIDDAIKNMLAQTFMCYDWHVRKTNEDIVEQILAEFIVKE